jgi:hypothetical protein
MVWLLDIRSGGTNWWKRQRLFKRARANEGMGKKEKDGRGNAEECRSSSHPPTPSVLPAAAAAATTAAEAKRTSRSPELTPFRWKCERTPYLLISYRTQIGRKFTQRRSTFIRVPDWSKTAKYKVRLIWKLSFQYQRILLSKVREVHSTKTFRMEGNYYFIQPIASLWSWTGFGMWL